jgi:Raf kinase inhibitor-like YbhB/YbcL family protein
MSSRRLAALFLAVFAAFALLSALPQVSAGGSAVTMQLASPDFLYGGTIPKDFTCDGADRSPQLVWTQPPSGTAAFALIADDPDAPVGTWVHWVLYDLPATATGLARGVPKTERLADGSIQGRNDFKRIGYGGPCPPAGKPHRYFFKLYALDKKLRLAGGVTKQEVERAMHGHIVGQAELMGIYGR